MTLSGAGPPLLTLNLIPKSLSGPLEENVSADDPSQKQLNPFYIYLQDYEKPLIESRRQLYVYG